MVAVPSCIGSRKSHMDHELQRVVIQSAFFQHRPDSRPADDNDDYVVEIEKPSDLHRFRSCDTRRYF